MSCSVGPSIRFPKTDNHRRAPIAWGKALYATLRWSKFLPEYGSSPHSQARRTHREMVCTKQSEPLGINKLRA
jgi:hypothetical protein